MSAIRNAIRNVIGAGIYRPDSLPIYRGGSSEDSGPPPPLTAYPLDDNGTVAALFGVGWLETDAPDYTSADYTYTGAATGGVVVATPTLANLYGSQAITVTSADILSVECEITANDATDFDLIGLGTIMSSGGVFGGAVFSQAKADGGPEWLGTGIADQVRTGAIAGFRVGIDFIGSTGAIRIKSSDGVIVSSTTFTAPIDITAYLSVGDGGLASPGDTTSLRLIVDADEYMLPCPAGAKNLLGDVIPQFAKWSPTDKAPNFTLSGGDLIATLTGGGFDSLRATIGKQTGSGCFEIVVTGTGSGNDFVGVGTASAGLAGSFVGLDAHGWGYFGGAGKFNNGVQTSYGAVWGAGDYMMVEVDFNTMLMEIFKNTVSQGTIDISSLSGPIFPMASLLTSGCFVAINCGQSPFSRTPTTGITPNWSADA
jgi:hypothetical protein